MKRSLSRRSSKQLAALDRGLVGEMRKSVERMVTHVGEGSKVNAERELANFDRLRKKFGAVAMRQDIRQMKKVRTS